MSLNLATAQGMGVLDELLSVQRSLPAVDRFAHACETGSSKDETLYRDLIPAAGPQVGQQYAFEVDLDACSGCKACVAACHSRNGLEEDELWRSVGQLVGGSAALPVVQHVTTACHHCIEPACSDGCPVMAYEKDPLTGIVRHLDDQCIGCQYCILKCPYDVPVYSKSKGIVRKCDMCHQRLAVGEAPACVQGCPNQAIRVRLVEVEEVLAASEAHPFLPAAPDPSYTAPTTVYKSGRQFPRDTLPADYFAVQRSHGHLPLVFMLVFTQMSVGAFFVEQVIYSYLAWFRAETATSMRPLHLAAALGLAALGLGVSVLHLGRPLYAFRALLGLRTSWLSREILAFGIFAAAATSYSGFVFWELFNRSAPGVWQGVLGGCASATGMLAIFCSVMVYVDTRRPCWSFPLTGSKFFLTALVLGIPTALLILLVSAGTDGQVSISGAMCDYGRPMCQVLLMVALVKMLLELSSAIHLRSRQHTPQKRSALLMVGELGMITGRRFFFGVMGGMVLPAVLVAEGNLAAGYHPLFVSIATVLMLSLLLIGELHERYLFFCASVAAKMPGAPGV